MSVAHNIRKELLTVLLVDLIGYPGLYLAGPYSNYDHACEWLGEYDRHLA